jgi:Rrf2 family protein
MGSLINISERVSLAFHGLVLIAKRKPERMSIKSISSRLQVSNAHLAKVFQRLKNAGIVDSTRGPSGGFILNRSAENISFLKVYEILESPVKKSGCSMHKNACIFKQCIFKDKINVLSRNIRNTFEYIKLSDFTLKDSIIPSKNINQRIDK